MAKNEVVKKTQRNDVVTTKTTVNDTGEKSVEREVEFVKTVPAKEKNGASSDNRKPTVNNELVRMHQELAVLRQEFRGLNDTSQPNSDNADEYQPQVDEGDKYDSGYAFTEQPQLSEEQMVAEMKATIAELTGEIHWHTGVTPAHSSSELFAKMPQAADSDTAAVNAAAPGSNAASTSSSAAAPTPGPAITCLKDLYAHPDGALLQTIADLPEHIRYVIKPEEDEGDEWKQHPLVERERIRRHFWRLQNDPTGQYAAIGFQNAERLKTERIQRAALIEETEQAEAVFQATQAASGAPARLTPRQAAAVAAFVAGKNLHEAADQVHLHTSTLQQWQKSPQFENELNQSIGEKLAALCHSMLQISDRAVRCVEKSITSDRCPKTALAILRGVGALTREVTQTGSAPYVAYAEQGLQTVELKESKSATSNHAFENGVESATLANAELNAANSATLDCANGNENGCKSATSPARQVKGRKTATWHWEAAGPLASFDDLPGNQKYAAYALIEGATLDVAAIHSQSTIAEVRQLLLTDRLFQAALNCHVRQKVRHIYCRFLALAETASEIITEAIDGGQEKIAIRFLRGLGML